VKRVAREPKLFCWQRPNVVGLAGKEELFLRDLFGQLDKGRSSSVGDRYKYGNLAKQTFRHLAIRQSSLTKVAVAITSILALRATGERMKERGTDRRRIYDDLGDMARNVPVMNLNQGQDFDGPLIALVNAATIEMDWELAKAVPLIRQLITREEAATRFSSARYFQRHAPTKLHRSGPRWYEHVPVISRVVTVWGHLDAYLAIDHYRNRS